MEEKDIVFSAYSRKLLRELKNTRLLLEKGDIKGAKKLLEEIIDETYADIEIEWKLDLQNITRHYKAYIIWIEPQKNKCYTLLKWSVEKNKARKIGGERRQELSEERNGKKSLGNWFRMLGKMQKTF